MKRLIPFVVLFLIQINNCLTGQITITQSDMPNVDDSVRVSYSTTIIDPTLTDTNYTWDFSSLVPNLQSVEIFDSPLSFAFPYNAIFNFINTSYGLEVYAPQ